MISDVLSSEKPSESRKPVKQDIAMEAANFTLKFDEKNLLDYIEDMAASGSKCNSQLIMLSRLVASSCR